MPGRFHFPVTGTLGLLLAAGCKENLVIPPTPGSAASRPAVSYVTPSQVTAGTPFTLTVVGTGFDESSVVVWNFRDRPTTYLNHTTLTAAIAASDSRAVGAVSVYVYNPPPGGGSSDTALVRVTAPASGPAPSPPPTITSLLPESASAGSGQLRLIVHGSSFTRASVVRWNGESRPTGYRKPGKLIAVIRDTDLLVAGTADVTVFTPPPGGGTTAPLSFVIVGAGAPDSEGFRIPR